MTKMSGGLWLIVVTIIYLIAEIYDGFIYHSLHLFPIQMVWIIILSLPLWIKPIAQWCNMKILWEK
jgi:hypothetical protein